ncbi:MAG: hypothetical protein R3Y43_05700 [Alphaproteobacteria bacterium]
MNNAINQDSLISLGEDFKMIRESKGYNLPTVVYETGLKFEQIRAIEDGWADFDMEIYSKLANFYELTLSVVLDYDVIQDLNH